MNIYFIRSFIYTETANEYILKWQSKYIFDLETKSLHNFI